MISYDIDTYEILDLTEPMFEACGIECPKMIGGTCLADVNARDTTGKLITCPGWSSKFPNAATEVVHNWTLSNDQDEQAGDSVTGSAWYALFRTPKDERRESNPMQAGVILVEVSTGRTDVTRYATEAELNAAWAKIRAETWECPNENEVCSQEAPCPECTD